MAMAEFGCEHATIPENILLEMSNTLATTRSRREDPSSKGRRILSPRLAHLITIDPLSDSSWDGNLPRRDIDYLKDGGAALDDAIHSDQVTEKGLYEALEAFKAKEMQSRDAIEAALKQL